MRQRASGEGSGRPAESYAGTYTGLCYDCTNKGAFLEFTHEITGADFWNFPPHCPSWRRDRESFFGFKGCEKCEGKGHVMISRSLSVGGSYSSQCKECYDKHYNHPTIRRRSLNNGLRSLADRIWLHTAAGEVNKRMKQVEKQGIKADYDEITDQLKDMVPPRLTDKTLAVFPKKWAKPNKYVKSLIAEYEATVKELENLR